MKPADAIILAFLGWVLLINSRPRGVVVAPLVVEPVPPAFLWFGKPIG